MPEGRGFTCKLIKLELLSRSLVCQGVGLRKDAVQLSAANPQCGFTVSQVKIESIEQLIFFI